MKKDFSSLQRLLIAHNYTKNVIIPTMKKTDINPLEINKIENCMQNLSVFKCKACGRLHYATSWRCKNRFCVLCQHFKTIKYIAKLLPIFKEWSDGYQQYVMMLNFTIKDMDNLELMVNTINNAFRAFYSNRSTRDYFKNKFIGGIRSLEVVIGENSLLWHVHLHCLALQKGFSEDFEWLKREWNKVVCNELGVDSNNKFGSVYIKQVKKENLMESCLEVIKYILKPNYEIYKNPNIFKIVYTCLKGRRQVNSWGILRKLVQEIEKDYDDDLQQKIKNFNCENCGSNFVDLKFLEDKRLYFDDYDKEKKLL